MSLGIESLFALLAIVVPFVVALTLVFLPRPAAKWMCIGSSAFATLCCAVVGVHFATGGFVAQHTVLFSLGGAEVLGFVVDRISTLLALAFVTIGLLISIYSVGYMSPANQEHPDAPRRRFYAYFTAFVGAMAGLVFSSTLVGQLVFFEITGVCSWGLISYYGTPTARKAGIKALIITHIGALGLYMATIFAFVQTGTFAIQAIAGLDQGWKTAVLICIVIAAWGKSAQLPFYMWLPSAMEAPTPVSAYLHGASMVKVGVAILARAFAEAGVIPQVVGWVVVVGAIVTMLFGFLMYLPQKDMKRLLAFSTITQLAYMFMGLGLAAFASQASGDATGSLAFSGSVAHIFNHAWAKTLFFLVAGSLSFAIGTRMLPKIRGLMKRYPVLAAAFAFAALAIAGMPPMNTFFSKMSIFIGGFQIGADSPLLLVMLIIMIIETVATFAYFLYVMGVSLNDEPSEEIAAGKPLPACMSGVLVALMVMVVVSGPLAAWWLA